MTCRYCRLTAKNLHCRISPHYLKQLIDANTPVSVRSNPRISLSPRPGNAKRRAAPNQESTGRVALSTTLPVALFLRGWGNIVANELRPLRAHCQRSPGRVNELPRQRASDFESLGIH